MLRTRYASEEASDSDQEAVRISQIDLMNFFSCYRIAKSETCCWMPTPCALLAQSSWTLTGKQSGGAGLELRGRQCEVKALILLIVFIGILEFSSVFEWAHKQVADKA